MFFQKNSLCFFGKSRAFRVSGVAGFPIAGCDAVQVNLCRGFGLRGLGFRA